MIRTAPEETDCMPDRQEMKQRELSRKILNKSIGSLEHHRVSFETVRTAKDILQCQSDISDKATHVNK